MRANTWYSPSKNKALFLAIAYLTATIALAWIANATNVQLCGCLGWATLIPTVLYGIAWLSRLTRDHQRAEQSIQERYVPAEHYAAPAPKTTPGSNRLFIPGDASRPPESL